MHFLTRAYTLASLPYFTTQKSIYIRNMAKSLVVIHFMSLQLSLVSGKNKDNVISSKEKVIRKGCMHTHYASFRKYKLLVVMIALLLEPIQK